MPNLKYLDKHNMVAFLKKPNGSDDFHEIVDFLKRTSLKYALTHNPTIYDSLVKQFWQTATVRTIANGNQELLATIDSKAYTITEASVRSLLQLADAIGITNLPDAEIHEGLATMGFLQMILGIRTTNRGQHIAPVLNKKIFGNMKRGFEGNHVPLLPAMLTPAQADKATTTSVEVDAEGAATTTASLEAGLDSGNIYESPLRSHDAPLPKVNTSGSAKDSVQLKELMELAPKLGEVALKRKSKKVVLSESEGEEEENSSKQGRKSQDDKSEDFITPSNSGEAQEQDISPTLLDAAKTLTQVTSGDVSTYKRRRRSVDTGMDYFSAAKERTKSEKVNTGSTPDKAQRKGKAKMVEENEDWDIIRAKLEANAELVKNMHGEDLSEEDFGKKEMGTWKLSQLKKLTFEEIKEKFDKLVNQIDTFVPMSLEATKARMKRYSEELQTGTSKKQKTVDDSGSAELQEKVAAKDVPVTEEKAGETTVPKEEEVEKSTKIKSRRLKTKARKGLNVDKDAQEDSETDKEEDMEAIGAIPVATKSPSVVNWKIFQQGQRSIYQIIRANGADTIYMSFGAMLKDITRDDLTELYRLVMQKYGANRPEDVYDRVLWSDLRTMFEPPLSEDAIWSLPLQQKMLNWRYYDSCGVHCLTLEAAVIYMLTERKYPLSSDACQAMLDMKLQGGKQNEECYQLLKLIEKQSKKTLP
ncbi:hypothetical protein Tco_1022525 [Tanacetum coccineum]